MSTLRDVLRAPLVLWDAVRACGVLLAEVWPTLLAFVACGMITAGILELLGRAAALIAGGLFLLSVVGWRPLAAIAIEGLAAVTESDDA